MSQHDDVPPPMDHELRALLQRTKTSFDAEANRHVDRAFDRLSRARPEIAPTPPDPAEAAAAAGKLGLAKLVVPVTASLLGVVLGAAVTYVAMPVRERIVYVDRPVAAAVSAPPSASPPSIRVDDLPDTPSARPAASASASASASSPSDVSSERVLLDEARVAFASGDNAKTLERLDRHRARFPTGALSEEREALAVRALAASGKKAEAAKRARAFVAKYPDSIMRPAVEAAAREP